MGKILLKNITLKDEIVDICINGNLISAITTAKTTLSELDTDDVDIVDCTNKLVIPGFINMHTHAGMALMRGLGEDMSFYNWIDEIWKVESNLYPEYVYRATKVACLEMIKSGTTTFNDQYWFSTEAHRAASELGLRSTLCYVIMDKNNPEEADFQKEECQQFYEEAQTWMDLSSFAIGIHAIYTVSEEMIKWAVEFARERNLLIHIHLSETKKEVEDCKNEHNGLTPVEYLDSLDVLGPDVIAAHTLWLSDNDVRILGERGVTCVHNINSNLKLSSGYRFRYNELRDAGANVCIGTDGCASSNNLDMLEAMKTSAMMQKAWREDPTAMPLNELLDTATVNGAKALGLNAGVVKEGALADLMIVDMDNYHFLSPGSNLANFVYSAHSDCIDSLIIDGRFVMKNRVVEGESDILEKAREVVNINKKKYY